MSFDLTENVNVDRNEKGNVQHLEHLQQPFVAGGAEDLAAAAGSDAPFSPAATPQALAQQYLRAVAPVYGIQETMLPDQDATAALTAAEEEAGEPAGGKLELAEEKELMGTTTISYQQTYKQVPVWEAGVSMTILPEPMRVTASQSSVHPDVSLPPSEGLEDAAYSAEKIKPEVLPALLGLAARRKPALNGTRQLIYQYDPNQRIDPASQVPDDEALQAGPPTLPLPPVPSTIVPGQHYLVTEVLFTLPVEGHGPVNWRAFVEVSTGAVLYLRAFVACAAGMIFRTDPVTAGAGAAVTPTAGAIALNPFRAAVNLDGLTNGNPQSLSGQFVKVVNIDAPVVNPPVQANPPASFFFDAPTREFAAVNAYHHCDGLFRHMQGMGFNIASYFDGTAFPVSVDACAFNDVKNAKAPGNAGGVGSDGFRFGLAGTPFPAVSIAADVRVVLHEFGHALLWDSVHSPNFGFAHSAGDSLAAILMDPESALRNDPVRRLETFPWILPNRNHGRDVAAGWGWDGANYNPFVFGGTDPAGYLAEQILSTTLFRAYRSMGGDSSDVNRRKMASRQMAYLIFRAIGSLASNPVTVTPRPEVFATALMNADIGTSNFEGYRGGAFHKVIRWSFEKQGLYQPPGAPLPVTTPGAPPKVDVYINDGRNGEYTFQPVHWENTDIWNRLAPSVGGGGGAHQTPVVGQTNFAYVRVKNRGTQHADNVVVRGYSANPGAGLSWPVDWTPMDTPQIAVPGGIPPGGSVVVGPFKWTPQVVGHECMFMEVSAKGDLSNIDPNTFFPCAAGPMPEWRLVPFDNNLGQRNVVPVAGAGGLRGLLSSFLDRRFLVRNPLDRQARMEVKLELPPFLAERGWSGSLDRREGTAALSLAPGASKEVTVSLRPGRDFSPQEILRSRGGAIRVSVYADGMIIGGMTYRLNPDLRRAPIERRGDRAVSLDDPAIEAMIRGARSQEEEIETPLAAAADGLADVLQDAGEDAEEALPQKNTGAPASPSAAGQLLSQLGVTEEGRVNRIRLRKVTVDIELDDE